MCTFSASVTFCGPPESARAVHANWIRPLTVRRRPAGRAKYTLSLSLALCIYLWHTIRHRLLLVCSVWRGRHVSPKWIKYTITPRLPFVKVAAASICTFQTCTTANVVRVFGAAQRRTKCVGRRVSSSLVFRQRTNKPFIARRRQRQQCAAR